MRSTKNTTKENICGTIDRTPGQNLMRAVTGSESPIGIPPYNYDEMFKIFDKALTPVEVDLLRRGYGFTVPRQTQKEIADELGIERREISQRFYAAIAKLQAYPFKTQLRALVPSLDELFNEVAQGRKLKSQHKELREMRYRCDGMQKKLSQSEEARLKAESQAETLSREVVSLNQKLDTANMRLEESTARIVELSGQAQAGQEQIDLVRQAFGVIFAKSPMQYRAGFGMIDQVSEVAVEAKASICVSKLEDLNLSATATAALNRAGVHTLELLCSSSSRSLSRLGVGGKNIDEIEAHLEEKGLCLRAG